MRIATIIVNYRTPALTLRCLEALAIERELLPDLKAVVVDNASGDGSSEFLAAALSEPPLADWVEFLPLALNGGFGWGNNQAILHLCNDTRGPEAIYLLNPDTCIEPGALFALAQDMTRRADAGAIGSQLLDEDGSLSGSAFRFPSVPREFIRGLGIGAVGRLLGVRPMLIPDGQREPVDWVTGASILIRTAALDQVGLFDSGFFLYFEEVELMHRMSRHGWKCYHCPESRVVHLAGAATGIRNGKMACDHSIPDYLFKSRHRFFVLTGGRTRAFFADIAWHLGGILAHLLQMIWPRSQGVGFLAESDALRRIGLGGQDRDKVPAITKLGDPPGMDPAWLAE